MPFFVPPEAVLWFYIIPCGLTYFFIDKDSVFEAVFEIFMKICQFSNKSPSTLLVRINNQEESIIIIISLLNSWLPDQFFFSQNPYHFLIFFISCHLYVSKKTYSVKQLIFDSFCRISGFTTTLVQGICVNDLFTAAAYFIKNLNLHCFLTLIKFTTKKFILLLGSKTRFALQWLW